MGQVPLLASATSGLHASGFPPMGHTYMTSAVGGGEGSPKSRQQERGFMNSVRDKGGGGQKIRKLCGRHIWKPFNGATRVFLLLNGSAVQKCFVPGAHAGHVNDGLLVILVFCWRQ